VPKLIVDGSGGASAFIDGVQWGGNVLYFSDVNAGTNSNGVVVEYDPAKYDSANLSKAVSPYRNPSSKIVGMALDKSGQLIGCSVADATNKPQGRVVKITKGSAAYANVAITNANLFISPNDLVVRKSDNTIYVTDPGYQDDTATKNYVWRIDPMGKVNTLKEFDTLDRPNGIGMTKDESLLYVSFTAPQGGPKAFVGRYKLKADGTVTDDGKLTEFADAGAFPDGLTVDDAGNVYVAVATGVDVFKASGQKWGTINVTPRPNNVRFGGADKKSLFITTVQTVFEVKVAVAGRTD
jgi:gluconolactonase